jgi:DNA-binding PadR family transcriptional regulator
MAKRTQSTNAVTVISVLNALKAVREGSTEGLNAYRLRKLASEGFLEARNVPNKVGRGRPKVDYILSDNGKDVLQVAKHIK